MLKTIREYAVETLSNEQKEAIYAKLNLNICEKEVRTQHVDGIHQKKAEVAQQINSNCCPKCGWGVDSEKGQIWRFQGV